MSSSVSSVPRNIGGGRFLSQVERHLGYHFRRLSLPASQNVWVSAWLLSCLSLDVPPTSAAVNVDPAFALTDSNDTASPSKLVYCVSDVPRLGGARNVDNALGACSRLHIPLTMSRAICGPAAVFWQLSDIMQKRVDARQPTSPFWIPVSVINETTHEIGASVAHERIVTVRGAVVAEREPADSGAQQVHVGYEPMLQMVNACDVRISHRNEATGRAEEAFLDNVLRQRHPVIVSDGELTRRSGDERRLIDQVLEEDVLRLKWLRHRRRLRSEYWCTRDAFASDVGPATADLGALAQRGVSVRLKDGQSATVYNMDDVQSEKTYVAPRIESTISGNAIPPSKRTSSIAREPPPISVTSTATVISVPRRVVAVAPPPQADEAPETCVVDAPQKIVDATPPQSTRGPSTTITLTLSLTKEQVDIAKLKQNVAVLRSRDGSVTLDLTKLGCQVISWREVS